MAMRNGRKIPASWWGKCAIAGIIGGVAMLLYWMVTDIARGIGPWAQINTIGATFPVFRPVSADFDPGATLVGLVLHLLVATGLGLAYGAIAGLVWPHQARDLGMAVMMGLAFGAAAWIVMGLIIGPLINPLVLGFEQANNAVAHLIYGVVTALVAGTMGRDRELRVLSVTFAPEIAARERERVL